MDVKISTKKFNFLNININIFNYKKSIPKKHKIIEPSAPPEYEY